MALSDVPEYSSVADTAKYFGCGEHSVRTGVADGSVPSIRLGRTIRIPLRMLVEHLAGQVAGVDRTEFPPLEEVS